MVILMAEAEVKKKKPVGDPDNYYKDEEVEEMVEAGEITPEEAGFMEGYNEKQSVQNKKPKEIVQD